MYKKFAIVVLVLTPVLVTVVDAFLPQVTQQIEKADSATENAVAPIPETPGDAVPSAPRGATNFFSDSPVSAGQPMLDPTAVAQSAAPMVDTRSQPAAASVPPPLSAQPPVPTAPRQAAGPLVDPALANQHLRFQKDGPQ